MLLNYVFITGLFMTCTFYIVCCLKRQNNFPKFWIPSGLIMESLEMYLIHYSFFSPANFWPLVKVWFSGTNILPYTLKQVNPIDYVKDEASMINDFFILIFPIHLSVCPSICLSPQYLSLPQPLLGSVCFPEFFHP